METELKFIHIRRFKYDPAFVFRDEISPKGGITIGYTKPDRKGYRKVAVAVCSEKDAYCRKTGREKVIERFKDGKYFTVRVDDYDQPGWVVDDILDAIEERFSYQIRFDELEVKREWKKVKHALAQ